MSYTHMKDTCIFELTFTKAKIMLIDDFVRVICRAFSEEILTEKSAVEALLLPLPPCEGVKEPVTEYRAL